EAPRGRRPAQRRQHRRRGAEGDGPMIEFRMPSLGADMEDGVFVEWRVEAGARVERGQVVCVVETQKGAIEVEIWDAGTIARMIAEPGQRIPVGRALAIVAAAGEDWRAVAAASVAAAP